MKKFKLTLISSLILFVFGLVFFIVYNLAEPKAYDFMTQNVLVNKFDFDNKKQIYGHDNVVIVVVDEKTVEKYRWPWKRELNCKIIEYLLDYAKPKILVRDSILKQLDTDNYGSDKKFFECLNKYKNIVGGFSPILFQGWDNVKEGEKYEKYFSEKYGLEITDNTTPAHIMFGSMIKMPYEYLDSMENLGHVYNSIGSILRNISSWAFDERTRSHEPLIIYKNAIYPSLALKTYLLANNNPKITLDDKLLTIIGDDILKIKLLNKTYLYSGFQKIVMQTITYPTKYYKIRLDSRYSHKSYSALDIMNSYDLIKQGKKPIIDPSEFENKIVIYGADVRASEGLNDNKTTPVAVNHPGVDIQATAIDNLINKDFLNVIPDWFNLIVMLICMAIIFFGIKNLSLTKSIITILSVITFYIAGSILCFYNDIIIWVITPIVLCILTTVFAYTYKYVIENRSKEKVKFAMGKYMSEGVMKNVIKNIDNLGLGGKKAVVTVLFADIRGFTSMSEKMSAQQVSEILNEYFTEMEPIITGYNGIINKFIGDAIMAVFGEPIQDENHSRNAVKCAFAMLERLKVLNRKWEKQGKPSINIGVGINTGEVFIGNIGSVNRMEYTVIGDTVNLASRLESYNKIYRTKILISPTTYSAVKDIADVLKISDVRIRGKANKMDIYEVLKVKL